MTVPKAMRDRHLCRFPLRRHVIHAAGGPLSIVAPKSAEALLRDSSLAQRWQDDDQPPYWADIWPASVGLARHLLRGPSLGGCRVTDLGCGIGVAGSAAGRLGASVLFADQEVDALQFARFNASQNGTKACQQLSFDWDREYLPAGCDLLLLADVAYDASSHSALLRQIDRVIKAGGRALCADPFRASTDDFITELGHRYVVELIAGRVHFDGRQSPLRLVSVLGIVN